MTGWRHRALLAMVLLVLLCTSTTAFTHEHAAVEPEAEGLFPEGLLNVVGNRSIEYNKSTALAVHQELDEHALMVVSLMELSETTMTTTAQKTKVRRVERCRPNIVRPGRQSTHRERVCSAVAKRCPLPAVHPP